MKSLSLPAAILLSILSFAAQPTAAAEVGVRVRFGLTDKEPETWNGTVSVKPGKVAALSGWRFEQGDHANGTESWVASTRPVVVALRTNAQKAKAKANQEANPNAKGKGKGGAAAKAKAKANAAADDGVAL